MRVNKLYIISSCLAIVLFTVGCSAHLSFDELTKDVPANLNTRTYSSSKMNYSISIPKTLELVEKEYNDTTGYDLYIDTLMEFEKGASMLSVYKYHSAETVLEKEWNKLTSNRQLIEDFRIYSEGVTDFLSVPAYYEHSACTISKKNTETISFLFRGDASIFYLMSLQVITEEGYPDNMQKLLYCAKTIKILP